jgi:hypothetical protein
MTSARLFHPAKCGFFWRKAAKERKKSFYPRMATNKERHFILQENSWPFVDKVFASCGE